MNPQGKEEDEASQNKTDIDTPTFICSNIRKNCNNRYHENCPNDQCRECCKKYGQKPCPAHCNWKSSNAVGSCPWIERIDTRMNACSLEVLHNIHNGMLPLAIGCYELLQHQENEELEGTKRGQIRLYMIPTSWKTFGSEPTQVLETTGILDGKWFQGYPLSIPLHHLENARDGASPGGNKRYVYATAGSNGDIELYALLYRSDSASFYPISSSSSSTADDEPTCLSLDWCKRSSSKDEKRILSSYADGTLAIHTFFFSENEITVEKNHGWKAHSLCGGRYPAEVWTCAWVDRDRILSGGDDGMLKGWGLEGDAPLLLFQMEHGAGVTCISPHPTVSSIFASGSYDEEVCIWKFEDTSGKPRLMSRYSPCGGGIWRLKWHPNIEGKLLVAAMRGGAHVFMMDMSEEEEVQELRSLALFSEHESMVYGADWITDKSNALDLAATCSFYDQRAFLWDVNVE